MTQINEQTLNQKLTIKSWRDINIVVNHKFLRKKEKRFKHNEKNLNDDDDENEIENMQTNHDIHVASIVYTRDIREQNEMMKEMRQNFRRVNENWHRFISFSILDENVHDEEKRKQTEWKINVDCKRRKRHRRMRTIDVNDKLRNMMHDEQI